MKKILLAFLLLTALGANAQNKKKTTAPNRYTPEKVEAMQAKQAKYENAQNKGNAAQLKKDGTPDMRYAENKANAAGPKKKDGTPDMRYSQNKNAPKKKN